MSTSIVRKREAIEKRDWTRHLYSGVLFTCWEENLNICSRYASSDKTVNNFSGICEPCSRIVRRVINESKMEAESPGYIGGS
jgi:hypothetical protein